jgi:hypothetical protein
MKWTWDYSPAKRRAFILDEDGFVVIPPRLSRPVARTLMREHNRILEQAIDACVRSVVEHSKGD